MGNMYEIIKSLCDKRGVKPGKMCADLKISRGVIGDLKAGRTRELSIANATKIASYFDVPLGLLKGEEYEKTPTDLVAGVTDDDIKFALFGGDSEITDEMFAEVKQFAQFVKKRVAEQKEGQKDDKN